MDNSGTEDGNVSPKSGPSTAPAMAHDTGEANIHDHKPQLPPAQSNAPSRPSVTATTKFQSEPILDRHSRMSLGAADNLFASTGTQGAGVSSELNHLGSATNATDATDEGNGGANAQARNGGLATTSNTSRHLPMGPPQISAQIPGNTASSQSKMTVETETVPSVPVLGVSTAGNSSLKQKRSQDSVPRLHNTHRGAGSGLGGSTNGGTAGKRRSLRLGQGSKADIFAAKVASAVDEANSSDSDETFVYDMNTREPRSMERSRLSGAATNGGNAGGDLTRDSSRESRHMIQLLHPGEEDDYNSSSDYRGVGLGVPPGPALSTYGADLAPHQLRRPYLRTPSNASIGAPHQVAAGVGAPSPRPDTGGPNPHAPRAFVTYSPRRKDSSQRTKNTYLQRWRTLPGTTGATDDDDDGSGYIGSHGRRGSTLGERQPLFSGSNRLRYSDSFDGGSPHDFLPKSYKTPLVVRVTLWMVSILIGILAITFLAGLAIISSRPLSELDAIALNNVFTSDKELVFSMILRAKNPGLFTITIEEADMDVFATSAFIKLPGDDDDNGDDDNDGDGKKKKKTHLDTPQTPRTMLLGTIHTLESPVSFPGGFINPQVDFETVSVKLFDPARNGSDTSAWEHIIGHPFDLTVKGTLKYTLLIGGEYRVSVSADTPVTPPLYSGELLL